MSSDNIKTGNHASSESEEFENCQAEESYASANEGEAENGIDGQQNGQKEHDEYGIKYRNLISITGLPKSYDFSEFKNLLKHSLQVTPISVQQDIFDHHIVYANFTNEQKRFRALTVLDGYKWQGSKITAAEADISKEPKMLNKIGFSRVGKPHWQLPIEERVEKALFKHLKKEYADQLKAKASTARLELITYSNKVQSVNSDLSEFCHWQTNRRKGLIVEVTDMVASPLKEGFLTSCEFAIGKNKGNDEPVVGFRIANNETCEIEVAPFDHLKQLSEKVKAAAKAVEKFVILSGHDPWDFFAESGLWRFLYVRTSDNDSEVLVVAQIAGNVLNETEYDWLKDEIKNFFSRGDGSDAGVTSFFIQKSTKTRQKFSGEADLVFGKPYIEESILGHSFRIPPQSTMEQNSSILEELYENVLDMIGSVDKSTTILDVNCDIGVIGTALAKKVKRVICFETNSYVAEEARLNLGERLEENVELVNEKREKTLAKIIDDIPADEKVVAVIRVPSGVTAYTLYRFLVDCVRKCEKVEKIILISFDITADSFLFNKLSYRVGKKKNFFIPIKAVPFDVGPYTNKYTMLIEFERYNETKWKRIMAGNPRPIDKEYYNRIPDHIHQAAIKRKEVQERKKQRDRTYERKRALLARPSYANTNGFGPSVPRNSFPAFNGRPRDFNSGFAGVGPRNYNDHYNGGNSYGYSDSYGQLDAYGMRPGAGGYGSRPFQEQRVDHRGFPARDMPLMSRNGNANAGLFQRPHEDGYYSDEHSYMNTPYRGFFGEGCRNSTNKFSGPNPKGYHRGYMAGLDALVKRYPRFGSYEH